MQKGAVVIPKASSKLHLQENTMIFDWQLSKEDEKAIDLLSKNQRLINPPFAEFEGNKDFLGKLYK